MYNYCTLFDSNFLLYGLALHQSLCRHATNFHLYILAFDTECFNILEKLKLKNTIIIHHKDFETETLLKLKKERSIAEYCWTCTPSLIDFCITKYNLNNCTYLDSDIYFYADPTILIDEMQEKSVLITSHNFSKKYSDLTKFGKYCVQFVTFKITPEAMNILREWKNNCIDWCYNRIEGEKFGDQKYLDKWPIVYSCVHELLNIGGGYAPWNIERFELYEEQKSLKIREKNKSNTLVFFHFHNIKFNNKQNLDKEKFYNYFIPENLIDIIFKPYLNTLKDLNKMVHLINPSIPLLNDVLPNYTEDFINNTKVKEKWNHFKVNHRDKKICLYGAGFFAEKVLQNLDLSQLNIIGFIDADKTKKGTKLATYPVYHLEDLKILSPDTLLLTMLPKEEVIKSIKAYLKSENLDITFVDDIFS